MRACGRSTKDDRRASKAIYLYSTLMKNLKKNIIRTKSEAPGKYYFKMTGTAEMHILVSVYVAWKDAL